MYGRITSYEKFTRYHVLDMIRVVQRYKQSGLKLRRITRLYLPVAPVAYQVILEPGIGQFRELEPRRVHTRVKLGLFLVDKLTCGKRESVS